MALEHRNLADPDYEPRDEELGELVHSAFAGVRAQNEAALRKVAPRRDNPEGLHALELTEEVRAAVILLLGARFCSVPHPKHAATGRRQVSESTEADANVRSQIRLDRQAYFSRSRRKL